MQEVPKQWLAMRVTVSEAEHANCVQDRPFGNLYGRWERLKKGMTAGDELWEFVSPPESWAHRCGRQGYAVVRRGEIVASLMTSV
jgi:hypothetical protein